MAFSDAESALFMWSKWKEREAKAAGLKLKQFAAAWRSMQWKYGFDITITYIQGKSNKKRYTRISISFNQQNSLAVHLASQSIQVGEKKEAQEIKRDHKKKRAGKKRRKGSRRE